MNDKYDKITTIKQKFLVFLLSEKWKKFKAEIFRSGGFFYMQSEMTGSVRSCFQVVINLIEKTFEFKLNESLL